MEDLGPFLKEGVDIGSGIHGSAKDFRVFMRRLRLADETT